MRTKTLLASSLALALISLPGIASAGHGPRPGFGGGGGGAHVYRHNWGPRWGGRWIWGWRSPGGWGGYRPAFTGWVLPGYWIAPRFYISDWGRYGFPAPRCGTGWSRYYDDAVLTDRDGRVIDVRRGVDWDRYDDYRDDDESWEEGERWREGGPPPRNAKGETTGAIVGGVVGGVAGAAIGRSEDRRHEWREDLPPPHGEPEAHGKFHGDGPGPHWAHRGDYGPGWGETVVTTTYRPVTTTVTTVTEEWVEAPDGPRKRVVPKRTKLLRR